MIGEATTLESSPAGIDGDGFDVFASLRGGVESDNFSSGAGEAGGADTDEAVSGLDLVAVAGGKEKLDTTMSDTNSNNSSEISTPVGPDLCEKFGTIACIGCDFALLCAERQAAMATKNNEDQPYKQLSTLEQLLQEDKAPGEIVWAQPTPDDDVSREQLLTAEEEQSINDSSNVFESEPEPKPRPKSEPEPEPEGQTLSDTQPSSRPSNKQRESAAPALPQFAESRNSESLNHEVDRIHSNDEEKSTTAHIANIVKKTTSSDDGGANPESNSSSAVKASKEPLVQIDSDNTDGYIRQDELPRAVDRVADDPGKLVNRETTTVRRATQTTQRSNKHADQEVSSAVNTTEQISSANTHQAIKISNPESAGSIVATTHSQKEPAIEKVSSTLIDANDTLADNETSAVVDREDGTQERPSPKPKSISAENNNLLKKTTPKNITTRPNSDSSTDFEVSVEMSLEAKKNPSIGKQNPLADDKKDNISSPSAVESVDYSRKTLPETRLVNDVQNTSDGEDSAVKLVEKESAPSKKAVVKNHNTHYSDSDSASVFNQIEQVETVANTPAVKLPAETASWASENEIFVVDREESFVNNHRDESMQREAVLIDSDNDLPTLPQNERAPKADIEQDLEQKNTTEINIQLQSDQSSGLLPKLDEMVNSVLPPSRSLNYELLPKPDATSSGLQEHNERQTSELLPNPDEASNRLIDQADFEDNKPARQKAQQTRMTQPNENDTIYVDLRNEPASSEVDSLHSQPTADYTNQIEMNNDNDLNCQLNDNSGNQAEKLHEVAFAHPLAALWTDDSRLNPENNKISKGSSTSVTSWLTKLVGAVAVYVACSRREGTLGISN